MGSTTVSAVFALLTLHLGRCPSHRAQQASAKKTLTVGKYSLPAAPAECSAWRPPAPPVPERAGAPQPQPPAVRRSGICESTATFTALFLC